MTGGAGAEEQAQSRSAAARFQKVAGGQKIEAFAVAVVKGVQKQVITGAEGFGGQGFFTGQPAGQTGVLPLCRQIAGQQAQAVPQHVHDAGQLAGGAFGSLPAQAPQGIVGLDADGHAAGYLHQTVGVVLALKGVFLELGAFVKSIAHAPIYKGLQGAGVVRTVGKRPWSGVAVRGGRRVGFGEIHGMGRVAKKMVGRVLEPPEHALAHGFAQQVAQSAVRNGPVRFKAAALISQQAVDSTVVAHQVAHQKIPVGHQPASVHASASLSRARATARS